MTSSGNGDKLIYSKKRPWDEGTDVDAPNQPPQYGNYRNYYSIRREAGQDAQHQDPRLKAILAWLVSDEAKVSDKGTSFKRVLDVGCNSGHFTLLLCNALRNEFETVIGVDVDRELILLAGSNARRMGISTSREEEEEASSAAALFKPRVLGSGRVGRGKGGVPRQRLRLEDPPRPKVALPLVVRFLQSDWVFNDDLNRQREETGPENTTRMQWNDMAEVDREDKMGYQLILALSVTKWIHIHHFDSGIRHLFARIATCLSPSGVFILEPQAYKSYKEAIKITAPHSRARKNFHALQIMPDDFAWILTCELGLSGPHQIRAKGKNGECNSNSLFSCSLLLIPSFVSHHLRLSKTN